MRRVTASSPTPAVVDEAQKKQTRIWKSGKT